MASITELREAIATNLSTISGLRTTTNYVPDNINPPYAMVAPTQVDYNQAFHGGLCVYNFTVTVVVGRVDARTAQNSLDTFCASSGSGSIKTAIESDRTLGGNAFDCRVTQMRNYGTVVLNDNTYLAAEFDLVVQAN